ncbi:MAG: epoxyqueuosine reductase [Clostridia bacterium]|nr:epoxyqueuosine reductase [Clostridia bacterium]
MKDRLIALARSFGFEECAFASVRPVRQTGPLHPQAAVLSEEITDIMPDAKCVMLCAMPYRPFIPEAGQAHVDAYYLTSNRAHEAVQQLARAIAEQLSLSAVPSPPIFIKPLAVRSGLGEFGRNGLVSVGQYGTRAALQTVLLNADLAAPEHEDRALSPHCTSCGACVKACPVGALDGTGRVDISRCLRAQPEGEAFPEPLRKSLGGSLLGCDICQRVCPRNAQVIPAAMPDELRRALDLSQLLSGNFKPLIPFLGKNNARRQRLTARALIAAANLKRHDLLPLIAPLRECRESEMVKEHAEWAYDQLNHAE